MAGVSLRRALASGFGLIRRRPLSVFAWGLVGVVFIQAPMLWLLGYSASDVLAKWGQLQLSEQAALDFSFAMQQRFALVEAAMLPAMVVRVVITAAIYRAVLEPRRSGFASLRIGSREAWLLLLSLTCSVLIAFAVIVLELVVGLAVVLAMNLQAGALAGLILVPFGVLALIWAAARLSLAGPMTFADRGFRLFESWSATRGQGLRLVGLALALFVLALLFEALLIGADVAVLAAITGGFPIDSAAAVNWLKGLMHLPPGTLALWLVPIGIVAAALYGAMSAIFVAPWATAYADLKGRPHARA